MRRASLDRLMHPERGHAFEVDVLREHEGDVIEGYLVCRVTRAVWPLVAGLAIVTPTLKAYVRQHANVFARLPIADPRLTRFLLAIEGRGFDRVNFDDVVSQYCDLAVDPPDGYRIEIDDELLALERLLARVVRGRPAYGIDLGCSVGRSVFILRTYVERALGVDYGLAVLRRARNIAQSQEDFFLPGLPCADGEGRGPEVKLDLDRLVRPRVDFLAAQVEQLPIKDDCVDVCVIHAGDQRGAWQRPTEVACHALRVVRRSGIVIAHKDVPVNGSVTDGEGPWCAQVVQS